MADEYIRKQDAVNVVANTAKIVASFNYQYAIDALLAFTPADVVPVVHAHWIRHENADIICGYYVPSFECSKCRAWKEDDSDFCPDCGAKMDGEEGME